MDASRYPLPLMSAKLDNYAGQPFFFTTLSKIKWTSSNMFATPYIQAKKEMKTYYAKASKVFTQKNRLKLVLEFELDYILRSYNLTENQQVMLKKHSERLKTKLL
jgi:hypothetical protein